MSRSMRAPTWSALCFFRRRRVTSAFQGGRGSGVARARPGEESCADRRCRRHACWPTSSTRSGPTFSSFMATSRRCAVSEIKARFKLPVMKAIAVETKADLAAIARYAAVADHLLFDARAPREATRPGGLGKAFDWRLLENLDPGVPFMLSGGLDAGNVGEAMRITRAPGRRCILRCRARARREGSRKNPRLRARRARCGSQARLRSVRHDGACSNSIPSAPGRTSTAISASMAAALSPRR